MRDEIDPSEITELLRKKKVNLTISYGDLTFLEMALSGYISYLKNKGEKGNDIEPYQKILSTLIESDEKIVPRSKHKHPHIY